MTGWPDLERELDAWRDAGRTATFWWRDDDACAVTPALEHLLALRWEGSVPLALAVVPAGAQEALAQRLASEPEVAVLQHGYAHASHAPPGEKKQELGAHRPPSRIHEELKRGRRRLEALFGRRACPVLVPPWNRLDEELTGALLDLGFGGLSLLGPRRVPAPAGLVQVDVHVDIVAWRTHRGFVGTAQALEQVLDHLAARRAAPLHADEPTGLMTHHLDHDAACWRFLAEFLRRTTAHPAARWLSAPALFGPVRGRTSATSG